MEIVLRMKRAAKTILGNRRIVSAWVLFCFLLYLFTSRLLYNFYKYHILPIDKSRIFVPRSIEDMWNSKQPVIPNSVGIGLAITSVKCGWSTISEMLTTFPIFHSLLPSFCQTASPGYAYTFYLAYDNNDAFFNIYNNRRIFRQLFMDLVATSCVRCALPELFLVRCNHTNKVAWAQNDAMVAAYSDRLEYYYRVNDDTYFNTTGWTEAFINTLRRLDPPNVGVVGPNHTGGNTDVIQYDFVHYTHYEIFGYHYPRNFVEWYAVEWIYHSYSPERSMKLRDVQLLHTEEYGRRYWPDRRIGVLLNDSVRQGKAIIDRY